MTPNKNMKFIITKKTTIQAGWNDITLNKGDNLEFNFDHLEPITYNDIEELRDWCESVLEEYRQELMYDTK